jgi:hypothetical protein
MTSQASEKLEYQYEHFFGLDDDQLQQPHTAFEKVREVEPVSRSGKLGFWVVSDHENATKVLKDGKTFSNKLMLGQQVSDEWQMLVDRAAERQEAMQKLGPNYGKSDRKILLFSDPPEHGKHRKLIMGALTPAAIKSWSPRIQETADLFVEQLQSGKEVEFVDTFANPYTMTVIADILGFPRDQVPQMLEWTEDFNAMVGNPNLTDEEIESLVDTRLGFDVYCNEHIEDRIANPGEDIISRIVSLNVDEDGEELLDRDQLFQLIQLVMVGGSETSATALSKMIQYLAANTDMWALLREDPAKIPQFMEEMLRLHSPVQGSFRAVTEDVELAGKQVKAGDMLWVGFGAASRDRKIFEDADSLDLDRKHVAAKYLAFGAGPHTCPGTALTRFELRMILENIIRKFSKVEVLDSEVPPKKSFNFYGPARMMVKFTK